MELELSSDSEMKIEDVDVSGHENQTTSSKAHYNSNLLFILWGIRALYA